MAVDEDEAEVTGDRLYTDDDDEEAVVADEKLYGTDLKTLVVLSELASMMTGL